MGYSRARTGDEVLERLAQEKEQLNEVFRKLLRDAGTQKAAGEVSWFHKQAVEQTVEQSLAPSWLQKLMASFGALGSAHLLNKGVGQYIQHAFGKPDNSYGVRLNVSDLPDLQSKHEVISPATINTRLLKGNDIFNKDFDVKPGTLARVGFAAYDDDRLRRYRKLLSLYGKNAPSISPYTVRDRKRNAMPAAYSPNLHTVNINPAIKDRDGHILAHELGHAKQQKFINGKLFRRSQLLGSYANLYGAAMPFFRSDADNAQRDAAIGTLGHLPTLGVEFDASLRGSNMMKHLAKMEGTWNSMPWHNKLKYRLGAFRGFPTYLAAAAAPLVSYATMNALGRYNPKPNTLPDTANQSPHQTLPSGLLARGVK